MKATFLLPIAALTLLTLGACNRDKPAEAGSAATTEGPSSSAAERKPPSVTAPPPRVGPAPPGQSRLAAAQPPPQNPKAARDIAPFEIINVAACDAYSKAVEQCLNVHTDGATRYDLRVAYAYAVEGWQEALSGATPATTVAQQCEAFRAEFNPKLKAAGCAVN